MRFIGPVRTRVQGALQPGNVDISHGFSTSFIRRSRRDHNNGAQRVTNPKKGNSRYRGTSPVFCGNSNNNNGQSNWKVKMLDIIARYSIPSDFIEYSRISRHCWPNKQQTSLSTAGPQVSSQDSARTLFDLCKNDF